MVGIVRTDLYEARPSIEFFWVRVRLWEQITYPLRRWLLAYACVARQSHTPGMLLPRALARLKIHEAKWTVYFFPEPKDGIETTGLTSAFSSVPSRPKPKSLKKSSR